MRNFFAAFAFAIAASASLPAPAFAEQRPIYTAPFSNVGIGGYDAVAYFTDGRPVRGAAQFKTTHQGVEYRFASAEHLAAFTAAPARYLPQYGGYCAWAISQNYTASGNPNNWRIVEGKLYLNYNTEIQRRWEGDIPGFIRAANGNWPGVLGR
jgi:YHS domain-containing protein